MPLDQLVLLYITSLGKVCEEMHGPGQRRYKQIPVAYLRGFYV